MNARRPLLTASISPEAYAGWKAFAAEHGTTVTAVVEALGLALGAGIPRRLEAEVVAVARQVSDERLSRKRDG